MRNQALISIILFSVAIFFFAHSKMKVSAFSSAQAQSDIPTPTAAAPVAAAPPAAAPPAAAPTADSVPAAPAPEISHAPTTTFPPLDPSVKIIEHDGYSYDPSGRRDPFIPFVDPNPNTAEKGKKVLPEAPADSLQSYDLGQFKLTGVLWNVGDPKAMVTSPTGKIFLVKNRTKIGRNDGFVAAIREGEIVVVEPTPDGTGAQTTVMTIQR